MDAAQHQSRLDEPLTQLSDCRVVVIIEMASRCEELDRLKAERRNFSEMIATKPLVVVQVRTDTETHTGSRKNPLLYQHFGFNSVTSLSRCASDRTAFSQRTSKNRAHAEITEVATKKPASGQRRLPGRRGDRPRSQKRKSLCGALIGTLPPGWRAVPASGRTAAAVPGCYGHTAGFGGCTECRPDFVWPWSDTQTSPAL